MALKKVRGNIERMFDKNLTDLVRGIRNSKENEVCADYFTENTENLKMLIIYHYQFNFNLIFI